MKTKEFNRKVNELFKPILENYGFTSDGSKDCTFYRQINDDIFHFILPDLGTKGFSYDIKVFPTSSLIDPIFLESFPDKIGIPSDSYSYLSARGVGMSQELFSCNSDHAFTNTFKNKVQK